MRDQISASHSSRYYTWCTKDNSSILSQSYCNSLQEMWNLVDPNDSDSKQKKMLQLGVYQVVWVCEHVPKIDTNLVLWQKIWSGIVHCNHKSLGQ
jgi:hypothetical protein